MPDRPAIATSIMAKNQKDLKKNINYLEKRSFDLVEFRADFLEDLSLDQIERFILQIRSLKRPIIFTLRTEGGRDLSDEDYYRINSWLMEKDLVDYVDVEFSRLGLFKDLTKAQPGIILSKHSFDGLASKKDFFETLDRMKNYKPSYRKIAYALDEKKEAEKLLGWARDYGDDDLVIIAMGDKGQVTRLKNPIYTSAFSFFAGLEKSAPGQLNLDQLTYEYFRDSSLGRIWLYSRGDCLVGLSIGERIFKNCFLRKTRIIEEAIDQLDDYLEGKRKDFDLAYNLDVTDFQEKVLEETRKISYGKTLSYKELARRIGSPKAYRAVGTSLSKNPLALLIPCHRVVKASGELSSYRYGKDIKKRLLDLEEKNHDKL